MYQENYCLISIRTQDNKHFDHFTELESFSVHTDNYWNSSIWHHFNMKSLNLWLDSIEFPFLIAQTYASSTQWSPTQV